MSMNQHGHHHTSAERAKILPAEKILSRFGLKQGQHLADLGCGQGYFALKAAEIVGSKGKIMAVDIEPERLKFLQQSAQEQGIAEQIETLLAQGESIPIENGSMDAALISNVLHELNDPLNYLRDTRRILKENGEVWIIEWQKKETPMGPPLQERHSVEEWIALVEQAGFTDIWTQIFNPAHILLRAKAVHYSIP